jgi:LDH2 family malate/lactate/ureidoglycolate dehydrogenase
MAPKTATLPAEDLKRLCAAVLAGAGGRAEDARTTAHILVETDMMGIATHGAIRVPGYAGRMRSGGIDAGAVPVLERRAPSLALLDGANALGPVVGARALAAAVEIAGETGIAYVGCRRSNHYGAIAPYAREACEEGFVMVAGTGASLTMPPWGGAELRLGNNPLCFAAPCPDGVHFILDMAQSVAARGKIRAALARGETIPEGWATDRNGRATTDPAEAIAGFLLPVGGHKGSGLSMAVDILSAVLSGARFLTDVSSWLDNPDRPQAIGHFFLLIDPARLVGREAFASSMARFQQILRATPAVDPAQPVLLPGEREHAFRVRALREGVTLPGSLLAELRELADRSSRA